MPAVSWPAIFPTGVDITVRALGRLRAHDSVGSESRRQCGMLMLLSAVYHSRSRLSVTFSFPSSHCSSLPRNFHHGEVELTNLSAYVGCNPLPINTKEKEKEERVRGGDIQELEREVKER